MNIKQIIISVIILVSGLAIFYSCDKIDPPFFKPVYTERSILTEIIVNPQDVDQALIDDFNTLTSSNSLIVPMIDLLDDNGAGQAIKEQFSVEHFDVMINRVEHNGNYGIKKENWDTVLTSELIKKGKFNLDIEGQYDDLSSDFSGSLSLTSTNGYDFPVEYSIYALEDSVVINGVECMNVLRVANEGNFIASNLLRQEPIEKAFNFDLSSFDKLSNVKLLFVIQSTNTGEVLQAQSQSVEGIEFSQIQNVLVEDFTGHRCVQCPDAHVELQSLMGTYASQLIPMAIHFGYFAEPTTSLPNDLRTSVGTVIGGEFNVTLTPVGLVNRIGSGDKKMYYAAWDAAISSLINNSPKVGIALQTELNGTELESKIYIKAFEQNDTLLKVQGFIVESHIISAQLWQGHEPEHIVDYQHDHVLRASINGNWGEDLTPAPFLENHIIEKNISYTLSSEWNSSNLSLIVIVYNSETKEILQAEERHL